MNPTIHVTLQEKKPVAVTAFIPGPFWHDPTWRVPHDYPFQQFAETGLLALADGRVVRLALKQQYQVRTLENGQVVYEDASPSAPVEVSYQFPGYPNLKTSCSILELFTADIIPNPNTQTQSHHNECIQEGAQAAKTSKRLSAIALANPGQLGMLKKSGEWEAPVIGRYHSRHWLILVLSNGCAFSYRPNLLPLKGPAVPYRAKERLERIRVVTPEIDTGKVRYDNGMKDVEFTESDYSYEDGVIYPATVEDWEYACQNAGRKPLATTGEVVARHTIKQTDSANTRKKHETYDHRLRLYLKDTWPQWYQQQKNYGQKPTWWSFHRSKADEMKTKGLSVTNAANLKAAWDSFRKQV